jgi:hypothetical protein
MFPRLTRKQGRDAQYFSPFLRATNNAKLSESRKLGSLAVDGGRAVIGIAGGTGAGAATTSAPWSIAGKR